MIKKILSFLSLLVTIEVIAVEDVNEGPRLSHESEASVVIASGNNDAQTYNLKQKTSYGVEKSLFQLTGSYLMGRTGATESARKWDIGARYDAYLYEHIGALVSYRLDSDIFSGIDTRHTFDLGTKYPFLKVKETEFGGELGYELQVENQTTGAQVSNHLGRVYFDWRHHWNEIVHSKVWIEYLLNFSNTADYRINVEPSLTVALSKIISLKVAYRLNYRSVPAVSGKKEFDTLYTTSFVAKF